MGRIGIVDPIGDVSVVSCRSGKAKSLGIPVPRIDRTPADRAFFGFESEMRRRLIVPDIATRFVAKILCLDERSFVASCDAVAAKDVVAGQLIGLRGLA